jgi:DNA polymerase-3 subunit delta
MIFKSYLLENNIETLSNYKVFLFYGENYGLKKDFKEKLKFANKKKQVLNLFQDEIIKNKNILINEVSNKSLFGEEKIIFINEVNDKSFDFLIGIFESLNEERIYLFCDILDKKSKLRSFIEKSKKYGITACYQDNEITIKKMISEKLKSLKGLTPQILSLIAQNGGLDRAKINNEIDKIKTYFHDKELNIDKINQLLNYKINDNFNILRDEALSGNKYQTNKLLGDTVFEGENNVYYLNSLNQRMLRLNEIANLKNNNTNIESLISSLKPPVFWKDKNYLIEQSKKWNKDKLKLGLQKTYTAEIEIKSNSSIKKDLIIKNLIIELCSVANASSINLK